eukprot:6541952-Pyramimonas_sp.AAC.1
MACAAAGRLIDVAAAGRFSAAATIGGPSSAGSSSVGVSSTPGPCATRALSRRGEKREGHREDDQGDEGW